MLREEYSEWLKMDRVVAVRDKEQVEVDSSNPAESHTVVKQQYLVKWKALPYSECTWEYPDGTAMFTYISS